MSIALRLATVGISNWKTRGGRSSAQQAVRRDPFGSRRGRGMVASRVGIRSCRRAPVVEGGTGLRGAWVCTEAAVDAVDAVDVAGSRLPVAPAEAASVVVGRSRRCRVEEDRHRAGMEAWTAVAEQAAAVVVVGCSAAARVWAGLAQAQARYRLGYNSLALTFVVVLVCVPVVGRMC
jgi:hypothetical protein